MILDRIRSQLRDRSVYLSEVYKNDDSDVARVVHGRLLELNDIIHLLDTEIQWEHRESMKSCKG